MNLKTLHQFTFSLLALSLLIAGFATALSKDPQVSKDSIYNRHRRSQYWSCRFREEVFVHHRRYSPQTMIDPLGLKSFLKTEVDIDK